MKQLIGARVLDMEGRTLMVGPVEVTDTYIRSQNDQTGEVNWHAKTAVKDDNGCVIYEQLHPAFTQEAKRVGKLPRKIRRQIERRPH